MYVPLSVDVIFLPEDQSQAPCLSDWALHYRV